MAKPTKRVITGHLERAGATKKQANTWATFLHGLDWDTIKPLARIAVSSHVHPALAAGMVIRSTKDDTVRATLTTHLEAKAEREGEGDAPQD
jgi:hypothetical protein